MRGTIDDFLGLAAFDELVAVLNAVICDPAK
jgi:hypothetical protein